MLKFDLKEKYSEYLKLVNLDVRKMSPHQITETRRAFIGGIGMLYVHMIIDIPKQEKEEDVHASLKDIEKQVNEFFLNEIAPQN